MDNHQPPVPVFKRVLCWLISGLLIWQPVAPAFAAALTPQGPTSKDTAGNGVPVINIATPNSAGVSHNQFHDYNVGPEGLILNNATGQLNPTQLGGLIQNNPNLKAGHEAQAIINEVNGGNRSQLQGYTEVAGKAASVMVANPYGITCNGCGFINTPNVTLTTGKPQFDASGKLIAVEATKGSITVEGKGLDASDSDALTLISRATEINAAIHARNLTVVAGANRVGSDGKVTPVSGEGSTPAVAVDTGALGGMYANRIHLVSSDKGVGVNLGNLVARQGDITLDASGQLRMNNSLASGSLTARGGSVILSGEHKAGGAVNVNSAGDLTLDNTILAGDGNLQLTSAGQLESAGSTLISGGSLGLSGRQVTTDSASQGSSAGDLHLTADTFTSQGQLTAGGGVTLNAGRFSNSGQIQTVGRAIIQADSLINTGTLQGGGMDLRGTQFTNLGQLRSTGNLAVTGVTLDQQGTLGSQGNTRLTLSDRLSDGQNAQVLSTGSLAVNAGTIVQLGTFSAGQGLTLQGDNLITGQSSYLVSGGDMTLGAGSMNLSGQVSAGGNLGITGTALTSNADARIQSTGDLQLTGDTLTLGGALHANGNFSASGTNLTTGTDAQLRSGGNMSLTAGQQMVLGGTQVAGGSLSAGARQLTHSGQSGAQHILMTTPGTLTNIGTLTATQLAIHSSQVSNSGLLQGMDGVDMQTGQLDNLAGGTLHSGGDVTLAIPVINNAGLITGDGALILNNATLQNSGEMNAATLGGHSGAFTNTATGLLYARGALTLSGDTLSNTGQLAGDQVQLTATGRLENQGTLQGTHGVSATGDTLVNGNGAKWLSGGMLSLNAGQLLTDGTLQGGQTYITAGHWTHSGSLLGQGGLTARVDDTLINRGTLMSQGDMVLQAPGLENHGQLLSTGNLTLQGVTPASPLSASLLALPSVPAAMALTNQQGAALQTGGTLALTGNTLSNAGTLSGHTVQLTADSLNNTGTLSGQTVQLTTDSLNNQGNLQAGSLAVSGTDLTNSGLIQGDSSLTLSPSGTLTNTAGGTLSAGQSLTLTTGSLQNDGLIQGAGDGQITAASLARNDGRILDGTALTLSTPQFSGGGWLQAGTLTLNADRATGSGTWLADQATLRGSSLTSLGTIQAGTLGVNYGQITNSGTLTGTSQLTVSAGQVNQQDSGRLLSGGDLLLTSAGFDQAGQVIALGNLTLQLANAFTGHHTLAAGKTLSITSQGSLQNQGLMQGQSVNLTAGGVLTNSGQITTGNGGSTLSGAGIVTDGGSSLQGGGDVTLTSRGDIAINGFTGTLGSLVLSAPGSIVNTALLYAGNNLSLLAASIRNQRGDMLAENNLWLQRDGAGNASNEVINTSGNIETRNGDISINTGHLLNQRDGLSVSQSTQSLNSDPAIGGAVWRRAIKDMPKGSFGVTGKGHTFNTGSCGANGSCIRDFYITYYYAPMSDWMTQKVASSQTVRTVTSNGGSARLSSGRNLYITASTLENNASDILAAANASLVGNVLNNQSWQAGLTTDFYVYAYQGAVATTTLSNMLQDHGDTHVSGPNEKYLDYALTGHDTTTENAQIYRAVIQAGGDLNASFRNNISNTSLTPNAGGIGGTLSAPALNTLSSQDISGSVKKQAQAGTVPLDSPAWQSQLQNALQQISSGAAGGKPDTIKSRGLDTSAYPLPSGSSGYFVIATNPQSPYLITVNPKLSGLGPLDPSVFGDLNALLGIKAASAPVETRTTYTDQNAFLGSSYLLGRLNLNPGKDYRFLGDAAFDTRYVSNAILNQTGSRYLNGVGSDLDQMRYLMDNAASAQKSLGLQFGESLSAAQIASLDHSILWWESTTINGQTVMVPKLYLAAQDATVNNGSVIAGNNVNLKAGNITSDGSTVLAANSLALDSDASISNLNDGLIKAGGGLSLSAVSDINNISATIAGKTVSLESLGGSINNLTRADTTTINAWSKYGNVTLKNTALGNTAGITAEDSLALSAGKDISVTGATLTSGGDMLMQARGDIAVNARQVDDQYTTSGFRGHNDTNNASVTWQGSNVTAGGNLSVQAGHDLTLAASDVNAGGSAQLAAANDLNLNSGQTSRNTRDGASETHSTGLDRTTVSAGNNLVLQAGQDINAHSAALAAEQGVGLQAGRDVNLLADKTTQGDSYRTKKKTVINDQVRQQGTEIASGGNTVVIAGRDVNSQAAQVTAQGDIGVQAVNDINLGTATESDYHYQEETKKKKGFLSKTTTHTISEQSATRETGSLLSGDNVSVSSGHDLQVQGSSVVGDGAVSLAASNNVDIAAATNTDTNWQFKEKKKSGLMSSGGIGFTIGSTKTRQDLKEKGTTQSQSTSTIGSNGGDVTITAGNQLHIAGSDVVAGQDLALKGDSVVIDPGHDKRTTDQTFEQKSSGLTVALTGAVIDAVNNAVSTAKAASKQSDSRLAALQATKSVLSGVQAVQANSVANATGQPDAGIHVSVSLSTQKSKSTQHQESDTVTGSTLNAGKNLSVEATGRQQQGNSGDIVIAGSHVKAAGDTSLKAERDIILTAAANTQKTTGSNSSSGGGVGVSIGAGQGGFGISVFASVNAAKGHEKGDGTDWSETTLDSGGKVSVSGGRDTTLTGAQVNGNQVTVDTGRNLTITSLQDSNNYDSKQSSVSAGGSFTFGSMSGSGYINFSQDKMHSIYDSVAEQSGIFAGDGGFSVTTGNHTQLNGGAIASTAAAADNHLNTGTLGFSDIVNKADYNVSHTGGGFSSSGSIGGQFAGNMATTLLSGMSSSGHAEGTTQAVVSQGTITIRDRSGQQQDLSGLQRDVTKANDAISPIFDKEKEQNRLQAVQMIGEIGSQVGDIARTEGQLRAIEAGKAELAKNGTKEPEAGASQDEWNRYNKSVENTES
ncbi:hypothetical protein A9B99_13840, partial [Mangrovibacter phragmitis]